MLSFTDCRSAHLPAVREFWASAYSPTHVLARDAALFDWQFGPAAGGRVVADDCTAYHLKLAMDGKRVVGCLGYIPTDVAVRGQAVRGTWLANWMVAPDHARVGLGPLLLREVQRQVDVIVNVGISDDAHALLVRLGWIDLGPMSRWVRALNPVQADLLLPEGAGGAWPAPVVRIPIGEFRLEQVSAFGVDAEDLWERIWGAECAGTRRSATLLNWRYAEHPTFRYELLELRRRGELAGLAVYRVEEVRQPAVRAGRIVEIVATPAAAATLISALCEHAASRGVAVLDFFCTSRRLDADLQSQGFQPGEAGRAAHVPTLFQPIDRRRSGIACMVHAARTLAHVALPRDPDSWYATKGDADQDRPN